MNHPYPVNPANWFIFQRTIYAVAVRNLIGGGIKFDFNVSPQPDPNATGSWIDYLMHEIHNNSGLSSPHAPAEPIIGTNLCYEFQVVSTPGTLFNFKSDPDNTGATPSTARPMIECGSKNGIVPAMEFCRWWCDTQSFIIQNGPGKIVAPLDPSQWSSVYGKKGDSSPDALAAWKQTIGCPGRLGLTFGGGFFYGHGCCVSNGTAEFQLKKVYSN